jgi:hypothetical protein
MAWLMAGMAGSLDGWMAEWLNGCAAPPGITVSGAE